MKTGWYFIELFAHSFDKILHFSLGTNLEMDTSPTAYQLTTSAAELNKIDKLRECGVSQYIGLPQVCGDKAIFGSGLTYFPIAGGGWRSI
jgi:hypothetical protein